MNFHTRYGLPHPKGEWRIRNIDVDGVHYSRYDVSLIISVAKEKDGRLWCHLSVALPYSTPSYKMLCDLKEEFLGPDRKAIQVFAPKSEHINIHPNCLHLWCCLEGDLIPDFRKEVDGITAI